MQNISLENLVQIIKDSPQTFLTGAAGTGKSHTLSRLKNHFKNPILLATTNHAANIIDAMTVHKFFMLGVNKTLQELRQNDEISLKSFAKEKGANLEALRTARLKKLGNFLKITELIIIDEVSMLSNHALDMIYYRLESAAARLKITIPRILFCGDLYQIPPVNAGFVRESSGESAQEMVFLSRHFSPRIIQLNKNHRSKSSEFSEALGFIRKGEVTPLVRRVIEEIAKNPFDPSAITIFPKNDQCDRYNEAKLSEIHTPPRTFAAQFTYANKLDQATVEKIHKILKTIPTPREITLKVGARVIFTATDAEYYNGLQGTVAAMTEEKIHIDADNGRKIALSRHKFTQHEISTTTSESIEDGALVVREEMVKVPVFEMRQFPLRLAYAITIHKSQGMSIERLNVACEGIFEDSMLYVALSRATNPRTLHISGFSEIFIKKYNQKAHDFMSAKAAAGELLDVGEVEFGGGLWGE